MLKYRVSGFIRLAEIARCTMMCFYVCSPAGELGAETDLFYSQFELCTREQKISEIKFIQVSSVFC